MQRLLFHTSHRLIFFPSSVYSGTPFLITGTPTLIKTTTHGGEIPFAFTGAYCESHGPAGEGGEGGSNNNN